MWRHICTTHTHRPTFRWSTIIISILDSAHFKLLDEAFKQTQWFLQSRSPRQQSLLDWYVGQSWKNCVHMKCIAARVLHQIRPAIIRCFQRFWCRMSVFDVRVLLGLREWKLPNPLCDILKSWFLDIVGIVLMVIKKQKKVENKSSFRLLILALNLTAKGNSCQHLQLYPHLWRNRLWFNAGV